jgi:chromate transporter
MIYFLLFIEFFKIGLFAIGGGLVTVPFLFDLSDTYGWFTTKELTDMIAISESTPGPLGVNMATYAGFSTNGILGAIFAVVGLITPSIIIIVIISKLMEQYQCNSRLKNILTGIRPAVLALIIFAGLQIAKISLTDILSATIFIIMLVSIRFWKKSPIFYLCLSAIIGIIFKL